MTDLIKALLSKEPTQRQLAKKLNVSACYISKLATGDREISRQVSRKIQKIYPELTDLCKQTLTRRFVN